MLHTSRQPHFSIIIGGIFSLIFFLGMTHAIEGSKLEVGKFSSAEPGGSFPKGWEPLNFEKITRHTKYELVKNGETVVAKATSNQSSSGYIKKREWSAVGCGSVIQKQSFSHD